MLKSNHTYKKHTLTTLVGGAILAMSANAHALGGLPAPTDTILTFDFNGSFTMYDPTGGIVATEGVTGTIKLDAMTMGGTAAMAGMFFGSPWTANADLSAYPDTLGAIPNMCNGAPMCAHSNIDFTWNSNLIPVQAAFGMTPMFPGMTDLLSLSVGAQFAVESIDTEPDGILGTAMTVGPFPGYTPYFTGTAKLVNIALLQPEITNQNIYVGPVPVPEPSEWTMMLVGMGLIGSMAYRRQKRAQAIAA